MIFTKESVIEWIKVVLVALIIALFLKLFVIELVWVNGASMEPTLQSSNGLIVNRLTYRFYSPTRGDIVIVKHSEEDNYVKRIIGLPGDTILIKNDKVYLNGKVLTEPYIKDFTGGYFGPDIVPQKSVFVMGDNRNDSSDSRLQDLGPVSFDRIIGKVVFRAWPFNEVNAF